MNFPGLKRHWNLFLAEWRRSVILLKSYPLDTINSIISFMVMSVVFMIGIKAAGDSSQVFGVIFFPVMLNLIGGPNASIRSDIELGVFEQVYISRYSLIKTAIIRTLISGLTSLIGSVLIAIIMHFFFLEINISLFNIGILFVLFSAQSLAAGILMAAFTLRFRKVETLLNFINILIMIELILPLSNNASLLGSVPIATVPFYGVVVLYRQLLMNFSAEAVIVTLLLTLLNTAVLTFSAWLLYKKSLASAKTNGTLGQY